MIDGTGFTPAINGINRGFEMLNRSAERLATGHRINRGADDPAGLVTSENLRSVLAALDAESRTLTRTRSAISVADGALGEVSDLLVEARGLAVAAAGGAGMSDEERAAIQMEMDSIVGTIDRLTGGAAFAGESLLADGTSFTADGTTVTIDGLSSGDLGATEIDGETFALASLRTGSALALDGGGASGATSVIEAASSRVASMRGQLGALDRNVIGSRLSAIGVEIENVGAAESQVRDTDYAAEISSLLRADLQVRASVAAFQAQQELATRVIDLLG